MDTHTRQNINARMDYTRAAIAGTTFVAPADAGDYYRDEVARMVGSKSRKPSAVLNVFCYPAWTDEHVMYFVCENDNDPANDTFVSVTAKTRKDAIEAFDAAFASTFGLSTL